MSNYIGRILRCQNIELNAYTQRYTKFILVHRLNQKLLKLLQYRWGTIQDMQDD